MEDGNFILIQGWMVNQLGLTGNNLLVYAIIYGFSQDGDSKFQGTRKYIAESIGKTTKTVDNVLSDLVDADLIIKTQRDITGVTLYEYSVNRKKLDFSRGDKISLGEKKFPQGGEKISLGGEKISPNNIIDNNIDNNISKEINKEKKRFVKPTLAEIAEHCKEKGYTWEPESFFDYHESRGWVVGKTPMKDWKAAMRTWNRNNKDWKNQNTINNGSDKHETSGDKEYITIL